MADWVHENQSTFHPISYSLHFDLKRFYIDLRYFVNKLCTSNLLARPALFCYLA